jgi:purine-binding chemotaxis protein CheW
MEVPAQLTFLVGGEEYAAPVLKIREIVGYDAVTRLPSVAPWIRGVMNVRGQALPVVDLAVKFGLPPTERTPLACVIVFEIAVDGQTTSVGAVVEAVNQVLEPKPADIEPAPAFGTQIRVPYLLGVMRAESKFALLLEIDRVLSEDELLSVTSLVAPGPDAAPSAGPEASNA